MTEKDRQLSPEFGTRRDGEPRGLPKQGLTLGREQDPFKDLGERSGT
jgi:hypothetical protein